MMLDDIGHFNLPGAADSPARSTDTHVVSHDMEDIFGAAHMPPAANGSRRADPVVPIIAPEEPHQRRRWPLAVALAGLAGMLVAVGAVAWLTMPAMKPTMPVMQTRAPVAAPQSTPARRPATPQPSQPQGAPAVAAVVASEPPTPRARPKAVRSKSRAVAAAPRQSSEARCQRLGKAARARCMRPHVLAADRALRAAYARAAKAGVGSRTLNAYRKRWSHARRKAVSDPASLTAAYRQMARQLDSARGLR